MTSFLCSLIGWKAGNTARQRSSKMARLGQTSSWNSCEFLLLIPPFVDRIFLACGNPPTEFTLETSVKSYAQIVLQTRKARKTTPKSYDPWTRGGVQSHRHALSHKLPCHVCARGWHSRWTSALFRQNTLARNSNRKDLWRSFPRGQWFEIHQVLGELCWSELISQLVWNVADYFGGSHWNEANGLTN